MKTASLELLVTAALVGTAALARGDECGRRTSPSEIGTGMCLRRCGNYRIWDRARQRARRKRQGKRNKYSDTYLLSTIIIEKKKREVGSEKGGGGRQNNRGAADGMLRGLSCMGPYICI